MLSFTGIDIDGNEVKLPVAEYVTINQEENVPADDLSVVFPYAEGLTELDRIDVASGDGVVFRGVVDEQQTVIRENRAQTKIIARSPAALLLDNESMPVSYLNPSASVIAARHLEPYGLKSCTQEDVVLSGPLNISKGMTQWQALYNFCINAYGRAPRVESDGTVNMEGIENGGEILFSNSGGQKYIYLAEKNKRYKLLSAVNVKTANSEDYNSVVENKDAVRRKINRQRYLDSAFASGLVMVADKMLEKSRRDSYEVVLVCPGRLINTIGASAELCDDYAGNIGGLYVSGICYRLNPGGEYTTLTLKKRGE